MAAPCLTLDVLIPPGLQGFFMSSFAEYRKGQQVGPVPLVDKLKFLL